MILEKDVSETDRFGRLLRYVWLADGRLANELIVAGGFAKVSTFPPDVKYQECIRAADSEGVRSSAHRRDISGRLSAASSLRGATVVFNMLFALEGQDEQVRCFEAVARHLRPAGRFLVEAFVPDLTRYSNKQRVTAVQVEAESAILDLTRLDIASQRLCSQHVVPANGSMRLYPVALRFAYPPELDLVARIAGLRLRDRSGGWGKEPFDSQSVRHVSVYEKP